MRKSLWRAVALPAGAAALLVASSLSGAQAAQGPPSGRGHGGGGGETTATNNLSVPTIMIGGGFTNVTCSQAGDPLLPLVPPNGTPSTGYPIDPLAYYYVQGTNTWQAQCYTDTTADAAAAWGDNLTGDAALKTNSPIRVELGLFNSDTSKPAMDGYTVVKLNEDALDRESPYGTLATAGTDGSFSATPTTFSATKERVYDSGVTFSIKNDATNTYVVPVGTKATAEINATGNVVYGYNLRVTTPGTYTITFSVPAATITGADSGTYDAHSVTLPITVSGSRGGGGGGGGHR